LQAITPQEIRSRIIADKDSGYNGIVSGDLPELDLGDYYADEITRPTDSNLDNKE